MKEMARDVRISEISPLRSPDQLSFQLPLTDEDRERIASYRDQVNRIISGEDRRLLAIVGPCSIHDPKAAIEYAEKLKKTEQLGEAQGDLGKLKNALGK